MSSPNGAFTGSVHSHLKTQPAGQGRFGGYPQRLMACATLSTDSSGGVPAVCATHDDDASDINPSTTMMDRNMRSSLSTPSSRRRLMDLSATVVPATAPTWPAPLRLDARPDGFARVKWPAIGRPFRLVLPCPPDPLFRCQPRTDDEPT